MNPYFQEVKKNFGFGCMRLPMKEGEVDYEEFSKMVDTYLEAGFNYFDTAHGYIDGKSEIAIRECLSKRHPRESFILADKLTEPYFNSQEEIRPFLESQLKACGVDYFDFYLMHAQDARSFAVFKERKAYETAFELKKEGKVRHVGFSFHDRAAVLEQILTEYPEVEFVQLQFNYIDYDEPTIESRRCYEICRKFGKPVIVMEPVRGGVLSELPPEADAILKALHGGSNASYAIRFAAGFEGVMTVLSGMGNMAMMNDNLSYMKNFVPLSEEEHRAVRRIRAIFHAQDMVPCTGCRYCVAGCPKTIAIPEFFSALNAARQRKDKDPAEYNNHILEKKSGKASDCIRCGKCEKACPQHINIRDFLENVAETFEAEAL